MMIRPRTISHQTEFPLALLSTVLGTDITRVLRRVGIIAGFAGSGSCLLLIILSDLNIREPL
jgi:hypothetical protein